MNKYLNTILWYTCTYFIYTYIYVNKHISYHALSLSAISTNWKNWQLSQISWWTVSITGGDAFWHKCQNCPRVLSVVCPLERKQLSTFISLSALKWIWALRLLTTKVNPFITCVALNCHCMAVIMKFSKIINYFKVHFWWLIE